MGRQMGEDMSISGILTATLLIGAIGLFIGLFLGVAAIKFKVQVDEKEEAVLAALPGNIPDVPVWQRQSQKAKLR